MMSHRHLIKWKRSATIVVISLLMVSAWWQCTRWYHSYLSEVESSKVRTELEIFTSDLSSIIYSRENLLNALSSYVETDIINRGDSSFYSQRRADTFLAGLYSSTQDIRNFAIAPQGKITMVHPELGNEEALGHDLLNDERSGVKDVSLRAINSRMIVHSEPYELRQGGLGVVLRKAVYNSDGFWGLVSMVIDIVPIIEEAGLTAKSGNINIAIRDTRGDVFYGSPLVFDQPQAIEQLNMTDVSWDIAATSIAVSEVSNKVLTFKVILAGFFILIYSLGLILLSKVKKRKDGVELPKAFFEQLTHIPNQTNKEHSGSPSRLSPILTSIAIMVLIAGLYRFIEKNDNTVQQYNFTNVLSKLTSDLERKLVTDREYLLLIAEELAQRNLEPRSFQSRVTSYVYDHPGLINVTWADDNFVIRHTAPLEGNSQVIGLKLLLPEPKRASTLAYQSGFPVYTKPFTVIQGEPAFELYVPIFDQNEFLGTLGGVYSINHLMVSLLNGEPEMSRYSIEVSDVEGNIFYRNSIISKEISMSKRIPITAVNANLWLRVTSYQQGPSDSLSMLMLFAVVLAFALITSIWIQYRESYGHWKISKELHQSQQHFTAVATASPAAILIISQRTAKILYANDQASKLFSHSGASIIGWNSDDLYLEPNDRQLFFSAVSETSQLEGFEQHMIRENGDAFWASVSCRLVVHDQDAVLVTCLFDLSERKKYEDQLYVQAYYDNLTELPNRRLAFTRLDSALQKAESEKQNVALLYIDVDRFKNINDSLGHVAGDQLLIEIANRLLLCVRSDDTVARLAGDEFAIILPAQANVSGANAIAEKIVEACIEPIIIGYEEITISVSVGIALYPDDASTSDQLIKAADTAMYQSKIKGRNQFRFYSKTE